jgi:hypothetical protein
MDEIIFLAGVIVLWCLVAKWIEGIRNRKKNASKVGNIVGYLAAAAVAIVLLAHAATSIQSPGRLNNRTGTLTEGVLSLLWAITLLAMVLHSFIRRTT